MHLAQVFCIKLEIKQVKKKTKKENSIFLTGISEKSAIHCAGVVKVLMFTGTGLTDRGSMATDGTFLLL
jgi:hypothetical protein